MRQLVTIILVLIAVVNSSIAQKIPTRIISSDNLSTNDEMWNLLGNGISNFEADLMYIYGKLYITSEMPDSANHAIPLFQDAYLMPLYSNLKKNGNTIINGDDRESFLLLNIHSDFKKTYRALMSLYEPLKGLTTHHNEGLLQGRIRFLIKDIALRDEIAKDGFTCIGLVGNKDDLESSFEYQQMPLIELDFAELTTWKGIGNIPFTDFMKIKETVGKIHEKGRKLSVVNCPNHKAAWEVLVTSQVDFINTNDPVSICNYLNERK